MNAFCDSSALVKLYADEPGSDIVRGLTTFVVSQLVRVEVPAALWRKVRLGELGATQAGMLSADFENDLLVAQRFTVVGITDTILVSAAEALARHPLRAYDAVQLASALAARSAYPALGLFACFDRDLAAAGAAEGFHVMGSA